MGLRDVMYGIYERRLLAELPADRLPRHVGAIVDGNRRWAAGRAPMSTTATRPGLTRSWSFVQWCDELGVQVVTLWVLSTDNLDRAGEEVSPLLEVITELVDELAATRRWQLRPMGALDLLPAPAVHRLKAAASATEDVAGMTVNIAVGYGGRHELTDAVRSLLAEHAAMGTTIEELAEVLDVDHIAEHLYTKGQPDPDLVIRTSGEQRLSGFLLWQSAHSEFYFCEALWPDFRRVDFLLRAALLRRSRAPLRQVIQRSSPGRACRRRRAGGLS
jgi:short-chain Z-isoprenyl diphosphate synthase